MTAVTLHPDRLFSSDPAQRDLARALYATVKDLPIVSPHRHTDPQWYADDEPFSNASALFITPDHYVFRMLYSQGVALEDLAIPRKDGGPVQTDARKIWRTFAAHYHLFRGTPTRVWLDHAFHDTFGIRERVSAESADRIFDQINGCLAKPEFRPRALFERFNIEVIATTESPLDSLAHHAKIRASGWNGRGVTAYRPAPVVDPEFEATIPARFCRFLPATTSPGESTAVSSPNSSPSTRSRRMKRLNSRPNSHISWPSARTSFNRAFAMSRAFEQTNLANMATKRYIWSAIAGTHAPASC